MALILNLRILCKHSHSSGAQWLFVGGISPELNLFHEYSEPRQGILPVSLMVVFEPGSETGAGRIL